MFLKILRQVRKLWKCVLAPMLLSQQPPQSCLNCEIELVEICIRITAGPTIQIWQFGFKGNQGEDA